MIDTMKPLVLIDKTEEKLIPINAFFFEVAQFLREEKLNEKYKGSLVLYPSGEILEITQVKVLGYFGEGFFSKMLSLVNATYNIQVDFAEASESFDAIKSMAQTYLVNDQATGTFYMPEQKNLNLEDQSISDGKALYAAFTLPEFEDCLDVMV